MKMVKLNEPVNLKKFGNYRQAIKIVCFSLFLLEIPMASANQGDLFNVSLGSSTSYDSNLFRLPNGSVPSNALGISERSDIINNSYVGLDFDKQYALQGFHIDYRILSNKYQNFKYLDYDAKNYNLLWSWAISPEFRGALSKSQNQFLVTFEDNRSPTQIVLTNDSNNIDFDYSPHGIWHVIGTYSESSSKNSQTFTEQASNSTKNIEGGLKYEFGSESFISLVFRDTTGQYLGQILDLTNLVDSGFKRQSEILNGLWVLSGKSNINFQLANIDYKSNNFSERDFSGLSGSLNYEWDILPKTNLVFNLRRILAGYVTDVSSYTVTDGFGVAPSWNISEKLVLKGNVDISQRDFLGGGPAIEVNQRSDKTIRYGLSFGWAPRSYVSTSFSLQHQERHSNFNSFDYSDNTMSASAQLDF
jgi:exopolysaccharide biosynthesis operon protein EpsL